MEKRKERGLKHLTDGRWQFSWWFEGRYHRRIVPSKGEAKAYLEKIHTQIREGRYLERKTEAHAKFEEACNRFLEWGKVNLSHSTSSQDKTFVNRWKASRHFKGKTLDRITAADVEAFKAEQRAKVGPRQTDYILSRLRRLFSLSITTWDICKKNPVGGGKVKFFNSKARRDRYVTPEEEGQILENADPRLRPAIILSIHTGLRQGELLSLTWADVDLQVGRYGQVKVRGQIAKDREDRHVPLNATARAALDSVPQAIKKDVRLFAHLGLGRGNLNRMWYKALEASKANQDSAQGQEITWHTLRHTFASRHVMAGTDLATLQRLMGHSNITTTMRYAHLARPHVEDAVLALDVNLRFSCDAPRQTPSHATMNTPFASYNHLK